MKYVSRSKLLRRLSKAVRTPFLGEWKITDGEWPGGIKYPQKYDAEYEDFTVSVIVNTLVEGLHHIGINHPSRKERHSIDNITSNSTEKVLQVVDDYAAEHFPGAAKTQTWIQQTPFLGRWKTIPIPNTRGSKQEYEVTYEGLHIRLGVEPRKKTYYFRATYNGELVAKETGIKGGLKKVALVADKWAQDFLP